jgi:hypothetical protein
MIEPGPRKETMLLFFNIIEEYNTLPSFCQATTRKFYGSLIIIFTTILLKRLKKIFLKKKAEVSNLCPENFLILAY